MACILVAQGTWALELLPVGSGALMEGSFSMRWLLSRRDVVLGVLALARNAAFQAYQLLTGLGEHLADLRCGLLSSVGPEPIHVSPEIGL